jgi:hypothetical protein
VAEHSNGTQQRPTRAHASPRRAQHSCSSTRPTPLPAAAALATAVPPARRNRYSVLATLLAEITSDTTTAQAEGPAAPHNPFAPPPNPTRARQEEPRVPQHRRARSHAQNACPSTVSTSCRETPSIPLDPGTPPSGPAPSHSPQPRNLRPLRRFPPVAPEPVVDEWERTIKLQLSPIQEAHGTDTEVEAIRNLLRLRSICPTVSPGKRKHRRILARLQKAQSEGAQSEGPQPEALEPVPSGSQRARHHNRRPAQPSERTLADRMHSLLQSGKVGRFTHCIPAGLAMSCSLYSLDPPIEDN